MVRKSILIAVILFCTYEIFLRFTNIHWDTSQNDKSANIISVQNFLYDYSNREIMGDTVIIGTSVSRKLVTDSLGAHYINLAFNAWNTYDGLELVKRSGKKPACLLVETNYAKNQILEPEISDNLSPISYYSGKIFKSLQLKNQPVGLLIGWGKKLMKARIDQLKEEKRQNATLYQLNLAMNRQKMNEPIPDSVLTKRFVVLKSLIGGFDADHTGIVFFEVPINEELQNTASMAEVREHFYAYFPKSEFRYIGSPAGSGYVYSDGVHLEQKSALEYTLYLKNKINELGPGK
jgi:hypothetical protein